MATMVSLRKAKTPKDFSSGVDYFWLYLNGSALFLW
jgi:hypothetical protein